MTPDPKFRTYGQAAPTYTFGVTGFQNSETELTAGGYVAPSCTSDYSATTNVADSPRLITCSGGSATNYLFDTTATSTVTVNKASSSTVITCSPGPFTYTGSPQTPCSATATGAGGLSVSVTVVYGNNTNAGTATANATYAGDANHDGSTATQVTFSIGQAGSTTTVTCPAGPYTYTGLAQTPCSVTVTGAGGLIGSHIVRAARSQAPEWTVRG